MSSFSNFSIPNITNYDTKSISNVRIKNYFEPISTISSNSGVLTIDFLDGNNFEVSLTENITSIVFLNLASDNVNSFSLYIYQDTTARSIDWASSFKWSGGLPPDISEPGAVYICEFVTYDEGTTWFSFLSGSDMK
jgi:hypothetical protein